MGAEASVSTANFNSNQYVPPTEDNTKERKPFEIFVKHHADFIPTKEVMVTSTRELCDKVNQLFAVYQDYYGCGIVPTPIAGYGGAAVLDTVLYFTIPPTSYDDSKPYAFEPVDRNRGTGDLVERYRRVTSAAAAPTKRMVITRDGKEGILPFLGLKNGRNPEWDRRISQQVDKTNNNVFVSVRGIDIIEILNEFYGSKEGKSRVSYNVVPIKPINNEVGSYSNQIQNWVINIEKINEENLIKASADVGLLNAGFSPIPAVAAVR